MKKNCVTTPQDLKWKILTIVTPLILLFTDWLTIVFFYALLIGPYLALGDYDLLWMAMGGFGLLWVAMGGSGSFQCLVTPKKNKDNGQTSTKKTCTVHKIYFEKWKFLYRNY